MLNTQCIKPSSATIRRSQGANDLSCVVRSSVAAQLSPRLDSVLRHRPWQTVTICCSETATVTSAAEMLTVRKDDLIDILRHWPEVMAELTIEAERLFKEVKVSQEPGKQAAPPCRSGIVPESLRRRTRKNYAAVPSDAQGLSLLCRLSVLDRLLSNGSDIVKGIVLLVRTVGNNR